MAKQHIKREAGQRYEFKKKQCKGLRFTLFQMYLKLNVQKCMQYIKMFGTIVHIEFFILHHVCGFIIFILLLTIANNHLYPYMPLDAVAQCQIPGRLNVHRTNPFGAAWRLFMGNEEERTCVRSRQMWFTDMEVAMAPLSHSVIGTEWFIWG